MAIGTLVVTDTQTLTLSGQNALTGSDYSPLTSSQTVSKKFSLGTAAANAAVGGADEAASFVTSIAGGGSASLDLTSITDIMQTAAVSLARVKEIVIRLLSVADDAAIGTAATYVTVGNSGTNDLCSVTGSGWFGAATGTMVVPNGGKLSWGTPSAAGVLVDGTHKIIKLANGDGAVTAKCQTSLVGGST